MQVSPTLTRRLLIVGVCLVSVVACCGLAWWQWERFSSANGTFQNLGYVLQWPLFGLFPAFMFWRLRTLRDQAAAREADAVEEPVLAEGPRDAGAPAPAPANRARPLVREGETGAERDIEDDELARYNRYLAELHRADTSTPRRRGP
ncbi:hypothetical protein CFN78_05445 [Amycolatopsis antarctica]|uniref:Uncharacterized protein n=1 Tax=Amycolatopsis antarctica TaxID=1854586 RepID=A0A263DAZ8_9PSEU|nr:hypothetical protein [Amycolatopsis antarctica]OZM74555.1 hypothetical protein CFN78_05445 [Amycolatopsis antarctica]